MGIEKVGRQLSSESLGVLAVLNKGGGFAQSQQDFEFANGLEKPVVSWQPRSGGRGFGATLRIVLTIGTRPRELLGLAAPLAVGFGLEWLEQALQRRSKSDFSNKTVLLEAERAAIFSNALDRMSRAMSTGAWAGEKEGIVAMDGDGDVGRKARAARKREYSKINNLLN